VHGRQFHEGAIVVNVVKSVAHTGITVGDLEASIAFWRDVLGFEGQRRMETSGEFAAQVTGVPGAHFVLAALAGGGHHTELLQYSRPAQRAHLCPRPCDVGSFHVAVNVDDLDAVEVCAHNTGSPSRACRNRRPKGHSPGAASCTRAIGTD
jgi:catechol 2,3-dioxygenase-like lactoylglutathione lyase family enzyme